MVQWYGAHRPAVMGARAMVSSTHYLATTAGLEILKAGGNAIDAGVAAGLCINVLEPHLTNLGGVAPIMIYDADDAAGRDDQRPGALARARSRSTGSSRQLRRRHARRHPAHRHPRRARRLAARPRALRHDDLRRGRRARASRSPSAASRSTRASPHLRARSRGCATWPSSVADLPAEWRAAARAARSGGSPISPAPSARLMEAERGAAQPRGGLEAARRLFYEGDIAEEMARFSAANRAACSPATTWPASASAMKPRSACRLSRISTVYACGPWCQGPVLPQALAILAGYDLPPLGHNSADYLHLVAEALKLAFADRDNFYGDPDFVHVPIDGLLSPEYAADAARADRPGSAPGRRCRPSATRAPSWHAGAPHRRWRAPARAVAAPPGPTPPTSASSTAGGNAFSATPSDSAYVQPARARARARIPSSRGSQSRLDPAPSPRRSHPASGRA